MIGTKTKSESFGSEYAMSAGDNAASRKQINDSLISKAVSNEHSFRQACMAGLEDIQGQKEDSEKAVSSDVETGNEKH